MVDFIGKVPRVSAESARPVTASAKAMGSGVGEGLELLGGAGADVFLDVRDKGEKTNAQDLMNTANRKMRELKTGRQAFGHPGAPDHEEEREGYLNLNESQALDKRQSYGELVDKELDAILEQAPNDRVRALMAGRMGVLREGTHNSLATHERGERDKYDLRVQKDTIAESNQQVTSLLGQRDTAGALQSIRDLDQATYDHEISQGARPKEARGAAETATTNAHVAALQSLIDQNRFPEADDYYNKITKDPVLAKGFDSTSRGAMMAKIQAKKTEREALSTADALMDAFDATAAQEGANGGMINAEANAMKALAKEKDPDKRTAMRQRVTSMIADRKRLLTARKGEIWGAMYRHIDAGGNRTSFQDEKPRDYDLIAGDLQMAGLDKKTKAIKEGKQYSDTPAGDEYKRWDKEDNDTVLSTMDLDAVRPNVTEDEFKELKKKRQGAIDNLEKLGETSTSHKRMHTLLATFAPKNLKGAFGSSTKTSEKNLKQAADLRRITNAFVTEFKETHKREPTEEEMTAEVVRLYLPAVGNPENHGMLGLPKGKDEEAFNKRVFQIRDLPAKQKGVVTIPIDAMPKGEGSLYRRVLKGIDDNGLPRTPTLIENVAGATLAGDTDRLRSLGIVK